MIFWANTVGLGANTVVSGKWSVVSGQRPAVTVIGQCNTVYDKLSMTVVINRPGVARAVL